MKVEINEGVTTWEAGQHGFDFPGEVETYSVTVSGKGASGLQALMNRCRDDGDVPNSLAGRMASFLVDNEPLRWEKQGPQSVTLHWDDERDANRFARQFGEVPSGGR